ncbi:hypothetical protein WJX81_002565 [Elliptochloris bilobata]|uniref:Pseudouridine synthase RsuA/RluA-like domain-containing protein n=1 Tax=Elliptochloris bilobata TaxID=381761 RepID=A0AAW1QXI6_9CHLO
MPWSIFPADSILQSQHRSLGALPDVVVPDAPPPRGEAKRGPRPGHAIVATALQPDGVLAQPLPAAVAALFAERYGTPTAAKRACRRGEVLVDGVQRGMTWVVRGGQWLELQARVQGAAHGGRANSHASAPRPTPLEVVYEDDHLAVVVKPPGMPVQGRGLKPSEQGTLASVLPHCLRPCSLPGVLWRPQHVHRLDAPTGGLVVVAKTRGALAALSGAFAQREVRKRYIAIVGGRLEGAGRMEAPLDGRPCLTHWAAEGATRSARHRWVTTVSLAPHTGRRHQLRRHLALLGHPVLGDPQYSYGYAKQVGRPMTPREDGLAADTPEGAGHAAAAETPRAMAVARLGPQARDEMCLWAVGIAFTHPFTGEHVSLAIPEPLVFQAARARELAAWRAKVEA